MRPMKDLQAPEISPNIEVADISHLIEAPPISPISSRGRSETGDTNEVQVACVTSHRPLPWDFLSLFMEGDRAVESQTLATTGRYMDTLQTMWCNGVVCVL